jgi:hypothetical protein
MATSKKVSTPLTPTDDRTGVTVTVKVPDIAVEIIEVTWKSGIDTARNKTKITAPHWTAGPSVNEEDKPELQHYATGSKKPGVYLVKSKKGVDTFEVKIKITKNTTSSTSGKLSGSLGILQFEGTCSLAVGTNTVSMKFKELPDVLTHVEGDARWTLEAEKASMLIQTKTRLEVFVVFDKPMSFYTEGVWAEALRLVFRKAKVDGSAKSEQAAAKITGYCHTGHGMTYDTDSGASHFSALNIGGPSFALMNYIMKNGEDANVVNCYDQAAAVQSLSGSVGVKVDWIYLSPYGFINTTNLVGVGSCNNPFYKGNGTKAVVASDDPKRTAFGNHAFVSHNAKIHDACAGPHLGTENLRKYMESAIDAKTSIPVIAPGFTYDKYYKTLETRSVPLSGLSGVT